MPLTASRLWTRDRARVHGSTCSPLREERENLRHRLLREQVLSFIVQFREKVGIDPLWQIDVEPICPPPREDEDDSRGSGSCELERGEEAAEVPLPNASISWIRDSWQATLRIRCDLPYQQRRRETLHELVELSFHGTGELWYFMRELRATSETVSTDLWTYLDNEYHVRRNQEVEKVVRLLLLLDSEEEE